MFVLIWATLLFSVTDSTADTVVSVKEEITAEPGLCVVIPCSFTKASGFILYNLVWFKCEPSKQECGDSDVIFHSNKYSKKVQSGFRGRVSLLEPDLSKRNCSIIINDLTESDSGSYQIRVIGSTNRREAVSAVSVKGLTQKPTLMIPPLTERQQTTLTCTAPGLCSGSVPKITWTWRETGEKDSYITGNITAFKTEDVTTVTRRHSSTLTFNPSAEHHGTSVTCKVSFTNNITTEETVTLNVTPVKKPVVTGMTTVKEGEALNLTCSVESFRPTNLTWTKLDSNKNLQNETTVVLQNDTGTATLVIHNVTADHSGRYICAATLHITALTTHTEVTVKFFPRILSSSACDVQSEVLTCVCISEGFPLPTIKLLLLETHTEYSVVTHLSKHTVKTRVTTSVTHHNYTTVGCVSSNFIGEANKNLTITKDELKQEDLLMNLLITATQPQVIIAFLIGILLSGTICCLARMCHRDKQKSSGNTVETLEMVTTQVVPLMDDGQSVENNGTHAQEAAEGGAEAACQSVPGGDVEPKEVEYSDIDFSRWNSPTGAEDMQETTNTEYAEIKIEDTEERQDDGGEDGDTLESNKVEEGMIGEDKETEQGVSAVEEEGEDAAVYSNVAEIMEEI